LRAAGEARLGRLAANIVHDEFVSGPLQIAGHGGSHRAQTDKAYLHAFSSPRSL
jgi:hypothetical protein